MAVNEIDNSNQIPGYDAFISYRRSDGVRTARWLRRRLLSFRLPKALAAEYKRIERVFLDVAYERGTIDFYEERIRPALMASRFLIVIATPDAAIPRLEGEDWIQREIEDFTQGPNARNLLIVRGKGNISDPLPAHIDRRFPNLEIVDLRGPYILGGMSPNKALRLSHEKLKVVAALTGVRDDQLPLLKQEEEKAQYRRLGFAFGGLFAVVTLVTILSIFALYSNWKAQEALESAMFSTGRMVQSLDDELNGKFDEENVYDLRGRLLNQGCDLLDKLRFEGGLRPETRPVTACFMERAVENARRKNWGAASELLERAIAFTEEAYAATGDLQSAMASVDAQRALMDFFEATEALDKSDSALDRLAKDAARFAELHATSPEFFQIAAADAHETIAVRAYEKQRFADAVAHWDKAVGFVEKAIVAVESVDSERAENLGAWRDALRNRLDALKNRATIDLE